MANLTQASRELFSRPADERFESLEDLYRHCRDQENHSHRLREPASEFRPVCVAGRLALQVNGHKPHSLNDWSFGQLCSLAGASKDTVNRLQPTTAAQVLTETLAGRVDKDSDLQALVFDDSRVRSVNGEKYKRLWSADVVAVLQEYAVHFIPPQRGVNGATGLYAGEQDLFAFLIDPAGWTEIGGEAFAPGFFVWNSEVGKRTVGISTFWFQAVCQNHIVWDAIDVVEFARKHTGNVGDALTEIRRAIENLVSRRDQRCDGFARVIANAMETSYGRDAEDVQKLLSKAGFTRSLSKRASEIAQRSGGLTLWSVVDALTQLARESTYAGARTEADQKASSLLALAAK